MYTRHLNTQSIRRNEIANPLLTHMLDSICDFNNPRTGYDSKMRLTILINDNLTDVLNIPTSIPTESNVNFKVLNKILKRFCIPEVDSKYEAGMNKLLLFRNKVAHGDNAIIVKIDIITEFIALVEDLMLDIIISIESSYKLKSYLK